MRHKILPLYATCIFNEGREPENMEFIPGRQKNYKMQTLLINLVYNLLHIECHFTKAIHRLFAFAR